MRKRCHMLTSGSVAKRYCSTLQKKPTAYNLIKRTIRHLTWVFHSEACSNLGAASDPCWENQSHLFLFHFTQDSITWQSEILPSHDSIPATTGIHASLWLWSKDGIETCDLPGLRTSWGHELEVAPQKRPGVLEDTTLDASQFCVLSLRRLMVL